MTRSSFLAAIVAVCAIVGALAACGGSDATAPRSPVGIVVEVRGSSGAVLVDTAGTTCVADYSTCDSSGARVACRDDCTFQTTRATLTLTAVPDPGNFLDIWTKACAGIGTAAASGTGSCTLTVHAGDTVQAAFTMLPSTRFVAPLPRDTSNWARPTWGFAGGATYECSLDGAPFVACTSPYTPPALAAEAPHTLAVRAVTTGGRVDPTPVVDTVFVTVATPLLHYTFDLTPTSTGALGGYTSDAGTAHYAPGKFGRAIAFDTTVAGHVTLTGTGALMRTASRWTVSLWYREDVAIAGTSLLDVRSTTAGWETYHGAASGTATTTCATTRSCFSFYDAPLGVWHNLVWRYDAPSLGGTAPLDVYLDGVLVGTLTSSTGAPLIDGTMPDAILGKSNVDQAAPIFAVDDVRIYDTVFSEAEQCTRVIGGTWNGTACSMP